MPKNVSCNAFYIYMLETKKRLEARGRTFRSMDEVVGIAGEQWEEMTQEQKNVYKEKAKEYKKSDEFSTYKKELRGRLPKKMRDGGAGASTRNIPQPVQEDEFVEPVAHLYPSDDEEAMEEFRKKHVKDRTEILDSWRWNLSDKPDGIMDMKCYLISFVSHCRTAAYEFFPAEVAVVEFTLHDGVTNCYHRLLGPHALPASIVTAATEYSQQHKIPFDVPVDGMTNDYVRVVEEILRFCRPSKNLRRLWCLPKEFNCVQGCIKFLQTQAKQTEIRAERINCVDDLFQLLCEWREKVCAPAEWRTFNDCDGVISTAPYYQHPGLLCEYHATRGVHVCAMATAKRASYYLLQRIQSHYPITFKDKHRPPEMPHGAGPNTQASATVPTWQSARAAVQQAAQYYLPRRRGDDETASVTSGATCSTFCTQRSAYHSHPDPAELGGPRTLPMQLRRTIGLTEAPDWTEKENVVPPSRQSDRDSQAASHPAPSIVASTIYSTDDGPMDDGPMEAAASINWDQNKKVRETLFKSRGVKTGYTAADQAAVGQNANQNVSTKYQGDQNVQGASYADMASKSSGFRPREPASMGQPDYKIVTGVTSSLATEFGNLRCTPAPVAFPPPQSVSGPGMMGAQNNIGGARPRGFMAPRVSMPTNLANGNPPIPRPPIPRGRGMRSQNQTPFPLPGDPLFANPPPPQPERVEQPAAGAANTRRAGGPPVKTQSRVKQMLSDRLRQYEESPEDQ